MLVNPIAVRTKQLGDAGIVAKAFSEDGGQLLQQVHVVNISDSSSVGNSC